MIVLFVFLIIIIIQLDATNINTLLLSQINDVRYQCIDADCSISTIIFRPNLKACQMSCLTNMNCRTITFDQINHQCELFADIPSEYGSLIAQTDVITFIAINRQLPTRKYTCLFKEELI